jgi:hypothetical protein
MSIMRRTTRAAAGLALLVTVAGAGAAVADDVANDLDTSVDATAEVLALNAGGTTGTVGLYVNPTNGDGKNGCNLTGSTTLRVSIASSNEAVATATLGNDTFTGCGDTKTITVTPLAAGSATITLTQVSNTTEGTFNLAPATFVVNVAPASVPNTAPSVTVTGVEGGAAYDVGSVPAATCQVTDPEDGPSSFPAMLSGPLDADGLGVRTASCSYTDLGDAGGGNRLTATASVTYSIVDSSAPEITHTLSPATPDGDNDWWTTDVTLDWTVAEPQSPNSLVLTGCADVTVATDQGPTDYRCSATSSGGSAGPETVSIKRDATDPTVALVGGPANGSSSYFGGVPAAPTCEASDATSGLASACAVSGYGTGVGDHTVTATAVDNAGNDETAEISYHVLAWTTAGFYAPVDKGGVLNTVKGGSTVPLKFELFAGPTELTDTAAVRSFTTARTSCDGSSLTDEIEITTTGGTSLRYDTVGGQFVQNWKTPTGSACYRVAMTAQDGSTILALFKTR